MTSTKRKLPDSFQVSESNKFLHGLKIFILKASIEKMRLQIFKTQLKKYGGIEHDQLEDDTTHLIVDDKMDSERMCRLLKVTYPPNNVEILKTSWLSSCFKYKEMVPINEFKVDISDLEKKDAVSTEDKELKESVESDVQNEGGASKPAKVGVMFRAFKKPKVEPEHQRDDADSDYSASDQEDESAVAGASSEDASKFIISVNKNIQVSLI